jgi:molybdate transport system permease protein
VTLLVRLLRSALAYLALSESDAFPIGLSLRVAALALLVVTPLGLGIAWAQARRRYRLRAAVDALVLLPLVLPPSVMGFLLVVVFGKRGPVGAWLDEAFGLRLVFTPAAAVIASAVVSLPIFVKTAQPAIEAVPRELENVARSLGLGPLAVFLRVTLPSAWRGVLAAAVLGFARALGEFGATLMFAGDIPGRTNTMPLEIFAAFRAGDDRRAGLYVAVLTAASLAVVAAAARLGPRGAGAEGGAAG